MNRQLCCFVFLLFVATTAVADWERVEPGIHYQRFQEDDMDIHVVRIDITRDDLRIVTTREEDRGTRVSEFARRNKALVAINADYFDKNLRPIGLAIGPCGPWGDTQDTAHEGVVAFGEQRAEIFAEQETMEEPDPWITAAVSGWPTIISDCRARTARQLPGSDSFTRSPHPRTAVGFSRGGSLVYFVVADGRRDDVPGVTLAELANFMRRRLRVCWAMNLDGGGSSAMWVEDKIVNRPSDGKERRVADHIAVVRAEDVVACVTDEDKEDIAGGPARSTKTIASAPAVRRSAAPK
jgi:exopolysaccharide biosynthesis protein